MRRVMQIVAVLAAGGLAWKFLELWVRGGSERFYLVLPPVFLGLYWVLTPEGWSGLKAHVRPARRYLFGLSLFGMLCYLFLTALLCPGDARVALRGLRPTEMLVTIYFLTAASLLVILPLQLVKWLCRRGADRTLGGRGADRRRHPLAQAFVREILPALLLVPILLPYLLGAMYVHRLKIANPATPREILGRDFEDVAFTTADGLTIRGWFIPANVSSTRTLLICHGLGANRSNFIHYQQAGDVLEANVLFFDFRGHGDSDGHTVSFGHWEMLDILAAVDYLRCQRPEQSRQLIALGISMGAASLARAAASLDPPFDAVILDSCFAAADELTDNILGAFPALARPCLTVPGLPIASLHAGCAMNAIRPIDHIAAIRAPLLIIHARDDQLIPVQHAERLFTQAAEPKHKWIASTGHHGSAWRDRDHYLKCLRELLPLLPADGSTAQAAVE